MTVKAVVISDSISEQNIRLTTLQLRYPKFIHGEFMTHRVFSRNASSSRAIPVDRLILDVIDDPVIPTFWGKNQPGMQAAEECNALVGHLTRERAWLAARNDAIAIAREFAKSGYHKQIVNRLLEPWYHINVVVTATDWSNFFALRCHKDAQPEMRMLAEAMRDAISASTPRLLKPGQWHLPYVDFPTVAPGHGLDPKTVAIRLSVARCARVSYLTQDGKTPTVEEDLKLYDRLVSSVPLHASPCEHQATPDHVIGSEVGDHVPYNLLWEKPQMHGNFRGWIQFRKTLDGECQ